MRRRAAALLAILACACDPSAGSDEDAGLDASLDAAEPRDAIVVPIDAARGAGLRVVTFNTGTSDGLRHDEPPDDGYGSAQAALSDLHYGNGLAWGRAIEETRAFLSVLDADVLVFQEPSRSRTSARQCTAASAPSAAATRISVSTGSRGRA